MKKSIHTREHAVVLDLLRRLRRQAGLTQIDLAAKLELTQSHVSKIERGEIRLDILQLRTFCRAVGVSLVEFAQRLERGLTAAR